MKRTLRLFTLARSESDLAAAIAVALSRTAGTRPTIEVTVNRYRGEITISAAFPPAAEAEYEALTAQIRREFPWELFSEGPTIDEMVAAALSGDRHGGDPRPTSVAVVESLTGGLVAARLTEPPLSGYVYGGVVAYTDSVKRSLGVRAGQLRRRGAVSPQIARALANAARRRFDAKLGVGITGVAGPGGGTPQRPVGTVFVSVAGPSRRLTVEAHLEGDRAEVRARATTVAMHTLWGALHPTGGTPGR